MSQRVVKIIRKFVQKTNTMGAPVSERHMKQKYLDLPAPARHQALMEMKAFIENKNI